MTFHSLTKGGDVTKDRKVKKIRVLCGQKKKKEGAQKRVGKRRI